MSKEGDFHHFDPKKISVFQKHETVSLKTYLSHCPHNFLFYCRGERLDFLSGINVVINKVKQTQSVKEEKKECPHDERKKKGTFRTKRKCVCVCALACRVAVHPPRLQESPAGLHHPVCVCVCVLLCLCDPMADPTLSFHIRGQNPDVAEFQNKT